MYYVSHGKEYNSKLCALSYSWNKLILCTETIGGSVEAAVKVADNVKLEKQYWGNHGGCVPHTIDAKALGDKSSQWYVYQRQQRVLV